jgi:hypothetical protein
VRAAGARARGVDWALVARAAERRDGMPAPILT